MFRFCRHTSERRGLNHYMLFGCDCAAKLSPHPIPNRLRLAVRWRREWARLLDEKLQRFAEEQQIELRKRLSYHAS